MPGRQVKNWTTYHALRRKGYSKRLAARIANSRVAKGVFSGRTIHLGSPKVRRRRAEQIRRLKSVRHYKKPVPHFGVPKRERSVLKNAPITKEQSDTGVILALLPTDFQPDPDGLTPSDLHVTIAFLGDSTDLPDNLHQPLVEWVHELSQLLPPITATVSEVGRLGDDDPPATVAFLDSPGILAVRNSFEQSAFEPYISRKYPIFKPHMTVGYGLGADGKLVGQPVTFDRLAVWWGGARHDDFQLGRSIVKYDIKNKETGDEMTENHTAIIQVPIPEDASADEIARLLQQAVVRSRIVKLDKQDEPDDNPALVRIRKSGFSPTIDLADDTSLDRNLVFGWANVSFTKDGQVSDLQGHSIDIEDLEQAAYDFAIYHHTSGDMHSGEPFGDMVESMMFTPEKISALGLESDALPLGWWVGFRLPPDQFAKVKSGERKMMSIQGKARLEPID